MKSNKTKSAMTALVVAAMVCTVAMPIKAAEAKWVNDNGTWSYVKEDGSKAKGWIKDDGCWYAFDDNGSMRTGWVASHEHWYFMGESGVMQSNAWVEENGARYFIKGTGVMAKDYVKDGYELTSDGKAIPLAETNSVVVTDPSAVEGQVIEGNLYVDVTTAKELELKGVTVKGKLVIIGDNQTAGKVTVTDSKIEAISTQTRNAEVVLSGETAVKEIVIEETSVVTPDKNFKGEVEKIEVQSTTKGEIKIEVPAQEVSTRTYASVDIQAPVEHLEVKTDTQVKVNADVKNVVVTESAKDTKVEVSKGNIVGTIVADAPVKIEGSGTVNKVEANVDGVEAGKDTIIKDVETGKDVTTAPEVSKPEKPSTGGTGGGSTGGTETRPTIKNLTVKKIDGAILTGDAKHNQDSIDVKFDENTGIHLVLSDNSLKQYASSNIEQGTGKWVGFVMDTGESSIIGLQVKIGDSWYSFTEADVEEAKTVGAEAGKFVFWLKADATPERTIEVRKGSNGVEERVIIRCLVEAATKAKDAFADKLTSDNKMDWNTIITATYYYNELSKVGNKVSPIIEQLTEYYEGIKCIDLSNEAFSYYEISTGALTPFTNLEELNLSGTFISELGGLKNMVNLQKLNLSYNKLFTEDLDDRLGVLANLTAIKELDLSNNAGIKAISALANLENLESLNVSNTSIKDFNVFWDSTNKQPNFPKLIKLEAKGIKNLASIAGLVEVVNGTDFNSQAKEWDLGGSVVKLDQENYVKAISEKFTSGKFTAPDIINKNLGEISIEVNADGEHMIKCTPLSAEEVAEYNVKSYKYFLSNNRLDAGISVPISRLNYIKLEELFYNPEIVREFNEGNITLTVQALDDLGSAVAESSMPILLDITIQNDATYEAFRNSFGELIIKSESFKNLAEESSIFFEIFGDREMMARVLCKGIKDNTFTWEIYLEGGNSWKMKMLLMKPIMEDKDGKYKIELINYYDWQQQDVKELQETDTANNDDIISI